MSEPLLAAIIAGSFGVVGALIGFIANAIIEALKAHNVSIQETRRRLIAESPSF